MDLLQAARRLDTRRNAVLFFCSLVVALAIFCLLAARSAYSVTPLHPQLIEVTEAGESWNFEVMEEAWGKRRSYLTIRVYRKDAERIGVYNRRLVLHDTTNGDFLLMPSEIALFSASHGHFERLPLLPLNFSRLNNRDIAIRGLLLANKLAEPWDRFEICALVGMENDRYHIVNSGLRLPGGRS